MKITEVVSNSITPHVIIDDFYTDKELPFIWDELKLHTANENLLSPEETYSAKLDGKPVKQNSSLFLDYVWADRTCSPILTYNRKLFDLWQLPEFSEDKVPFMNTLKHSDFDITLLSYYEDSDHYPAHCDTACLTALTWLYSEPKKYKGGDFILPQSDTFIESINNRCVIIPSWVKHEVTPVKMNYVINSPNSGRFTISQFIQFKT